MKNSKNSNRKRSSFSQMNHEQASNKKYTIAAKQDQNSLATEEEQE